MSETKKKENLSGDESLEEKAEISDDEKNINYRNPKNKENKEKIKKKRKKIKIKIM